MSNKKLSNMNEKHYTSEELILHMNSILKDFHKEPITEFLENSAGDGRLIDWLKKEYNLPVIAFDIHNETQRKDIKECNYLKEKIEYKKGRVAFINPPFGKGIQFVYKALTECDYVVSILGINSFINLDYEKYEVDTIDIFRKYDFGSCKVTCCIIGIKNKNS